MKRILYLISIVFFLCSCSNWEGDYVCPPCDKSCDMLTFAKGGTCPHCKMTLVKKSDLVEEAELVLNEVNLEEGSGVFLIEGGNGKRDVGIKVYYHKPRSYTSSSRMLIVIPGAGRNGDSYRDSWVEESEMHSVLILSPMYAEDDYVFAEYHLGGIISDLNLKSFDYIENTNMVKLDEEKFTYEVNPNREEWIFSDFDRIFDMVVDATDSNAEEYDIFGHSAGGQILHRMTLFHPKSKANRVLASNSGFYTTVDTDLDLPFGIRNAEVRDQDIQHSLEKNLTLFLGEMDNESETKGTLLRSKTVDKQGLHRLARGMSFYNQAKHYALQNQIEFNWKLEIVPNVGHNQRMMALAAAEYLYGD